jgi:regulatory protein
MDDRTAPATRPPRPVTPAYLERAAMAYLERYSSSGENLRRILTRKIQRRCRERGEDPEGFLPLIDDTLRKLATSGLVDDVRYAESRVATLRRRGGSTRAIAAKLASKGIGAEVARDAIAAHEGDDVEAARALARRRRLGPHRIRDRDAHRDKDIASLARAGFSLRVARAVVDGESDGGASERL